MKKIILLASFIIVSLASVFANDDYPSKGLQWSYLRGLEYRLKAGFNIGGTSPLPLPQEIRKINSYDPTLQIAVEADVVKWFDKWGMLVGLRLENKGMKTDANVKNYGMKMTSTDGKVIEGNWTGNVVTQVDNSYLTVPVLALYKLSRRWEVSVGAFLSYQMKGSFHGYVYEGYLREGNPTGDKVVFEDDAQATYDFSTELNRFQAGPQVGVQWKAFKHLNICADLTWGVIPIFKSDFETIKVDMYPIYVNLGFAYVF